MKRLKFKKPFNGMDNAKRLIPESYKVDGNEFEITDGNETYRVKWESSINEGTILSSSNKTQINEDMQKMRHLMGFKSEETLGTLKGSERLNENAKFGDILNKTKKLISESEEPIDYTMGNEDDPNQLPNPPKEINLDIKEGNLEGMSEMETEETDVIEEDDVEALQKAMTDSAKVQAAAKKINTRDEKIEAAVSYVNAIIGDDEALKSKVARTILKGETDSEETEQVTDTSMTNEGDDEEMDRFDEIFDGYED